MKEEELEKTLSLYGPPAPSTESGVYTDQNGYYRCCKSKRLIHRINYYRRNPETPIRWHIHHINGNKLDNRVENLIGLSPSEHLALHKKWGFKEGLPKREAILRWLEAKTKKSTPPRTTKKRKRGHLKRRRLDVIKVNFLKTGQIDPRYRNHPQVQRLIMDWRSLRERRTSRKYWQQQCKNREKKAETKEKQAFIQKFIVRRKP